jgi:copper chaperone CopZ
MSKALALVLAVALAGSATASEEESIKLKIYVDGMSCPTGCAPKIAKGLSTVEGAKDVKLEDFEKGLFTMSVDAKAGLKPDAIKKTLGDYKAKKIEATITGTISAKDKAFVLKTASGATYGLALAEPKACCSDEKAAAKKDAAKKDDCDGCPVAAAALKAKVETLAKENKVVTVTGPVGACCEVAVTIAAIDEVKKATN